MISNVGLLFGECSCCHNLCQIGSEFIIGTDVTALEFFA
jgi:hypothetical protein